MILDKIPNLKQIKFKNFQQYPNTIIDFKKIRNGYFIIPRNRYGIVIVDVNLKIIKKVKISIDIVINNTYIKYDETAIILNCLEINGYLVKISIHDFTYQIIQLEEKYHDMWLSRIYYWKEDFIILIDNLGNLIKINLFNNAHEKINKKLLRNIDPTFVNFLDNIKKNCISHPLMPRFKHNLACIYYVDLKRYIYVCRNTDEQANFVINFVENKKMILSKWDIENYTFDYEYDCFVATQEYKVEVFYKGKNIFKLNVPDRVYFGGKLFQDLQNTYLYVLDGCTKTNADVIFTKYKLPNV